MNKFEIGQEVIALKDAEGTKECNYIKNGNITKISEIVLKEDGYHYFCDDHSKWEFTESEIAVLNDDNIKKHCLVRK